MVLHRTRYYPLAVQILTGLLTAVAAVILLYLALVLLEANPGNPLVDFFGAIADWFAWLFLGMFTVEDSRLQAVLDYGLAALAYLGLGALVHGLGRRTAD
ncbi:hypothetical protein GCM10027447_21730 [Glycomyces halotolerans]